MEYLPLLPTMLLGLLWYLLRQKDEKQGHDIETLFALHQKDVEKLAAFELEIAKNHYPKPELDQRFTQLDATIRGGFTTLSADVKEMTKALHDHMREHTIHGGQ